MNNQQNILTLFGGNTVADRFARFHKENPRVYLLFEKFALQLIKDYGYKRLGAKMIMERVRWECYTEGKDERGFKINNDFIAHYARLFIRNYPQHAQCFEARIIRAA